MSAVPESDSQTVAGNSPPHALSGLLRVSSLTFASRILGLFRDAAMAASFGNGPILDAFTVAFRLPNITRRLFGEAAFSTAFLPVFVREIHSESKETSWKLATAILTVTAAAVTAVTVAAILSLLLISTFVGPGESRLLINLTALLFPYQIFVCVAAQASAVLHAFNRFSLPALLPIVGNMVWLGALCAAIYFFDSDTIKIYVVAAGVVLAGLTQSLLTIPALKHLGFRFLWDWNSARPRVREVATAVLPVLLGLSVTELNSLADGLFAWLLTAPADSVGENTLRYPLEPGTAAALYLGQRLYQFPLGVFGVALGTVLFPHFARHAAANRIEELRTDLTLGLKLSIAVGLPASMGLVLMARPLADALFRYGAFDAADSSQTAAAIAGYALGVWAFIALLIVNRAFYAVGDRSTPLRTGLVAALINIVLSVAFAWPFGGPGLAIGTSIAASIQLLLSLAALRGRQLAPNLRAIGSTTIRAFLATAVMALVCLLLRDGVPWSDDLAGRLLALLVPVVGAVIAYAAASTIVGLHELRRLFMKP